MFHFPPKKIKFKRSKKSPKNMYSSIHFQSKPRATTNASKPEVIEKLQEIVGAENVLVEPEKVEPYGADAVKEKFPPEAVVFPATTEEMSEILKLANREIFPVTARGGSYVMYTANTQNVPWQRVSNSQSGCSTDKIKIQLKLQQNLLEQEGIVFNAKDRYDLNIYQ